MHSIAGATGSAVFPGPGAIGRYGRVFPDPGLCPKPSLDLWTCGGATNNNWAGEPNVAQFANGFPACARENALFFMLGGTYTNAISSSLVPTATKEVWRAPN